MIYQYLFIITIIILQDQLLFAIKNQNKKNPIEHIIVICMENHSFDNMLGFMDAPIGNLPQDKLCNEYQGQEYCQRKVSKFQTDPDPPHGFQDMKKQLYGNDKTPYTEEPNLSGYAEVYASKGDSTDINQEFNCYAQEEIPVISTLAKEFKVLTNYFASIPTCTYPNKYFLHAATSMGQTANCNSIDCYGVPIETKTIYESLEEDGLEWNIYWQDWAEIFGIYPLNQKKENIIYDQYFQKFYDVLEKGEGLKDYTYIIPKAYWSENVKDSEKQEAEIIGMAPNTQHPKQDVRAGEHLLKNLYENLRKSDYWEKTALIITYDENGGFPDHIIPPGNQPNPSPKVKSYPDNFDFNRLGLRVPAIVVSPWVRKGVDTTLYEHSSIPHTIKDVFNLSADYLTPRDEQTNNMIPEEDILEEMRTDCPEQLPDYPSFEDYPLEKMQFNGVQNPELNIACRLLILEEYYTYSQLEPIRSSIKTEDQGMHFLNEAYMILGYRPMPNNEDKFEFKYLKKQAFQSIE